MNDVKAPGVILMMNLDSLLSAEQGNILKRERENTHHIHLYNVGQYWAAFDKSAFQAEHLTKLKDVPDVVKLKDNPFPIVMHIIDENQFRSLCKSNPSLHQKKKHIQIDGTHVDMAEYNTWYLQKSDALIESKKT